MDKLCHFLITLQIYVTFWILIQIFIYPYRRARFIQWLIVAVGGVMFFCGLTLLIIVDNYANWPEKSPEPAGGEYILFYPDFYFILTLSLFVSLPLTYRGNFFGLVSPVNYTEIYFKIVIYYHHLQK